MIPLDRFRTGLVLFLVFPFLTLIFFFRIHFDLSAAEFWWALKNSLVQAFFSAFFSVFLGFVVSLGFFCIQKKWLRAILEVAALLPNFLPVLFTLVAIFNFVDPFPIGTLGIVIVHVFIYFGLAAVLIANQITSRLGGLVEQAWVDGVSRSQFYLKVFFPLMKKELLGLFLFIFFMCFSSFSVPLVAGGGRGTTMEVLIYEKMRLSTDWGAAVFLSLVQSLIIFGLSWFSYQNRSQVAWTSSSFRWLRSRFGLLVLICFLSAFILGYTQGIADGFLQMGFFYELRFALIKQFFGTVILSLSAGALTFVILFCMVWAQPTGWFEKFLRSYFAPSTALTGFAFLLLGPNQGLGPWLKIPIAVVLLSITGLFRMSWESSIQNLQSQRSMAQVLGASPWLIFRHIEFPQLIRRASFLAGLVALWTSGDFAVSRILASRDLSLAMMTETLLSSYRISQASILSLLVFFVGVLVFISFIGAGRVLSRKLNL